MNSQAFAISEKMVGTKQRVMVTGTSKKNEQMLSGRTENMRWVHFEGPAHLINQFVDVLITDAKPNSLRGRWLDTDPLALSASKQAESLNPATISGRTGPNHTILPTTPELVSARL